jgi:hypothetical protein
MSLKNFSLLFGVLFLVIGVLGFVPGVTNDENLLLGIFQVSALHNIIHILSGVAALVAASAETHSQLYFRVFGVVYALVATIGWIQSDTVLGLIDVNTADNLLHTCLAVAILGIGFGFKSTVNTTKV